MYDERLKEFLNESAVSRRAIKYPKETIEDVCQIAEKYDHILKALEGFKVAEECDYECQNCSNWMGEDATTSDYCDGNFQILRPLKPEDLDWGKMHTSMDITGDECRYLIIPAQTVAGLKIVMEKQ